MNTCDAVRNRIVELCAEKKMTINKLAIEAAVPASSVKSILYGNSKNPGIVTLKFLCDGFGISLADFFDAPDFHSLEQEMF